MFRHQAAWSGHLGRLRRCALPVRLAALECSLGAVTSLSSSLVRFVPLRVLRSIPPSWVSGRGERNCLSFVPAAAFVGAVCGVR